MEAQEIDEMMATSMRAQQRIETLQEDNILTRQLVMTSEFMNSFGTKAREDFAYRSYYDAVLEHGSYKFTSTYYQPDDVPDGTPQACFSNAASLALSAPDRFTYVEGYACTEQTGVCVAHAWVEDQDGNVIDNTWSTLESSPNHGGAHYFGIKFSAEYLQYRADVQGDRFAGLLGEDYLYLEHMRKGMVLEDGVVAGERDE